MRRLKGRQLRQKRTRAKIRGVAERPRLNVFRSNKYIYASLVDDKVGKTIFAISDEQLASSKGKTKLEKAFDVGLLLGEKAKAKKIKIAVFDRAGYRYHGRVKALAEGARKAGLNL